MCGIVGLVGEDLINSAKLDSILAPLKNRGPDGSNSWFSECGSVYFGHTRLAVLDLKESASQPMLSMSKKLVIVFNGEIYNFRELAIALENTPSCMKNVCSDTRVLLEYISYFGLERALTDARGMFAFALYNIESGTIHIGRDRFGEKPIYYWTSSSGFAFSSDLNVFRQVTRFSAEVCPLGFNLYMQYGAVPAPYSIFKDVYKLEPGHVLTVSLDTRQPESNKSFWSVDNFTGKDDEVKFKGTYDNAVNAVDGLLEQSIKRQLVSDVPLGVFLSGGIDSSLIAAKMQKLASKRITSFSVGFHDPNFNEAHYAKDVASYLGTDHRELYVSKELALSTVFKLPTIYSEPFADSSQIPTYLVSSLARDHVTVCLTGDGGDEIFGGYNRHVLANDWWKKIDALPPSLRSFISRCFGHLAEPRIHYLLGQLTNHRISGLGDKLYKICEILNAASGFDVYRSLSSVIQDPALYVGDRFKTGCLPDLGLINSNSLELSQLMMLWDIQNYLPSDILTKVDRASMSVSLETRAPFLDPDLTDFSLSLPIEFKIRNGKGKAILRDILNNSVPKKLTTRPKMGFGVPLADWLRTDLREWAEHLIAKERLEREGYFNAVHVRQKWNEHLSGRHNWQHQLWVVLMFQAWLEESKL